MKPTLEQIFGTYMSWKIDDTTWVINFMNGTCIYWKGKKKPFCLIQDTGPAI